MASFQKRANGKWQYTISRMIDGKACPIRKGGFSTKKEAQTAAAEIEANLSKGIAPTKKIPFCDYFTGWLDLYKKHKISSTTLKHYEYTLAHIQQFFSLTSIQDIKRNDYQRFLNWLGENKSKETVAKINGHIKCCVKDAIVDRLIHIDFTYGTTIFYTNMAKSIEEKYLNYEDSKTLFNALYENRNNALGYSLLLLGFVSGLRFGELVGLTKHDFDFDSNTISINKTWGYKSASERGFGPTKNEQSKRVILISPKIMHHFKKSFESIPPNRHELVFFSPSSKYHVMSNTNANKLLKKVLLNLNIAPITVHGLRHTHASTLVYKGLSIQYISQRLGHSDIETTLKKYTHVLKELKIKDEQAYMQLY